MIVIGVVIIKGVCVRETDASEVSVGAGVTLGASVGCDTTAGERSVLVGTDIGIAARVGVAGIKDGIEQDATSNASAERMKWIFLTAYLLDLSKAIIA